MGVFAGASRNPERECPLGDFEDWSRANSRQRMCLCTAETGADVPRLQQLASCLWRGVW